MATICEITLTLNDVIQPIDNRITDILLKFRKKRVMKGVRMNFKFALLKSILREWHNLINGRTLSSRNIRLLGANDNASNDSDSGYEDVEINYTESEGDSQVVATETVNVYFTRRPFIGELTIIVTLTIKKDTVLDWYDKYVGPGPVYQLSIRPTQVNLPDSNTGSTTFTVESNIDWQITTDSTWISINPTTGNGDSTVSVVYGANTTTLQRNAVLSLMATNVSGIEVKNATIRQPGSGGSSEQPMIAVDLGLPSGTLWGDRNIGAMTTTERGTFYGWGEPTGTKISQVENYGDITLSTRGVTFPSDISQANKDLDVAYDKLGSDWHTPTTTQMLELTSNCTWTLHTDYQGISGLYGYEVRGKGSYSGNAIFIPCNGYRNGVDASGNPIYSTNINEPYYWSSEISGGDNTYGWGMFVKLYYLKLKFEMAQTFLGMYIRPVSSSGTGSHTLSVSPTSLANLSATGGNYTLTVTSDVSWTVSSTDESVCTVSPSSGGPSGTVTVTVFENPTTSVRNAKVIFQAQGVSNPPNVSVSQQASGSTELSLQPTLMSSQMGDGIYRAFSTYRMCVTGNALWLVKALGGNLDNVTVTQDTRVRTTRIDNWGYIMSRYYANGAWPGGISGTDWSVDITFTDGTTSFTGRFKSLLDEDKTTLLMGCYVNKVIRVPSSGLTSTVRYLFYPYTFNDSIFGRTTVPVVYYDIDNNTSRDVDASFDYNSTMFSSISTSSASLEGVVDFVIKPNTSGQFRQAAFIVDNMTLVHFLQETHSETRIYFGKAPNDRYRIDDIQAIDTNCAYLFCQMGSVEPGNYHEVSFNDHLWEILYPQNLTNTYNIVYEDGTVYDGEPATIVWDGITYVRKICSINVVYKFTKL